MSDQKPSPPTPKTPQEEIDLAKQALAQKRFADARRHLKLAERSRVSGIDVTRLRKAIAAQEQQQAKLARNSGWTGFFAASGIYFLLMLLSPPPPFWIVMAFGVVPILTGVVIGRLMGFDAGGRLRFQRAARAAGWAMFGYAFVSLIWKRTRFDLGTEAGQVFLVWVSVAALYALIAALIAGFVSARLVWWSTERNTHGTAS